MNKRVSTFLVTLGLVVALATPGAASAQDRLSSHDLKKSGVGLGTALTTLPYSIIKLCYAGGATVVGGLSWAFSAGDTSVFWSIVTPAWTGDWTVTEAHFLESKELEFIGHATVEAPESDDEIDFAAYIERAIQ